MANQKPTIMVVDDESSIRESFNLILEDKYRVITAASGEASLKKLVDEKVDIIYLDIRMPGMDGMETLKRLKDIDRDVPVIMVTAVNDVQNAGEAIKLGAKDYVVKPFDVDHILRMTETALKKKASSKETKEVRKEALKFEEDDLIGSSREIDLIRSAVDDIAPKEMNVAISGEPGTEKDLLAYLIHTASKRSSKPFVKYNIGKESLETLKRKLFGSGQGGFAATLKKEKGAFEQASGGILVLHNIENLQLSLQKEIAEVLQKKELKREGGFVSIPIDIRLVCTTTSSLKELVSDGAFSKELYEEVSEAQIALPPLKERSSDIQLFVEHLLEKYNKLYGKSVKRLSKDALETLSGYDFPGNVDELELIMENIVLSFGGEQVTCEMLPLYLLLNSSTFRGTDESRNINIDKIYEDLEKRYTGHIMKVAGGDREKAGRILGLQGSALNSKIEAV